MITFYHSGNCGDILASLPFCIEYNKEVGTEDKFNYTCIINAPAHYDPKFMVGEHPCGKFTLTEKMYDMLVPLLKAQPYINEVNKISYNTYFPTNEENVNLDLFRKREKTLHVTTLSRAYSILYPLYNDLHDDEPWLFAERDDKFKDKIILTHSQRYLSNCTLGDLYPYMKEILFIGTKTEFDWMLQKLPIIKYYPVKDFYETAIAINSCKLFISNQTMNFWIAEGLKAPRFVLRFNESPNCTPMGRNGFTIPESPYFYLMLKKKLGY